MALRDWRQLHASITGSERLSRVSFEARWLYTCLLAHQDDAGMFPWTLVRVRELTATCEWNFQKATTFRQELELVGLVSMDDEMVVIRRGNDLNGVPTSGGKQWVLPRFYRRTTADISSIVQNPTDDIAPGREDKRREDKRREDNLPSGLSATLFDWASYLSDHWQPFVSDDWQQDIIATFPTLNLLTESKKCVDWWVAKPERRPKRPASAFRNWCVKAVEIRAVPPALFRPTSSVNGVAPPIDYGADQRRIADQKASREVKKE